MAISVKVRKGSATNARARRHFRLRKKIAGTASRPRLVVSRSARHLFVQIVDDSQGKTLAYASTMEDALRKSSADKTGKSREAHQPWKMRFSSHLQIRPESLAKLAR